MPTSRGPQRRGKSSGPSKSKQRRGERKRRILYVSVGLGAALVLGLVLYFNLGLGSPSQATTPAIGRPISAQLYSQLKAAASVFTPPTPSLPNMSIFQFRNGTPWTIDGKPVIVYIGGEYCPYCAATRWPLTIALLRFGNFSGLEYMLSSPSDYFPNTPTFTYLKAKYYSPYVVFQPYEAWNREGKVIVTPPSNYTSVLISLGGGIPFVDFGGLYVIDNSPFVPQGWAQYNWSQIAKFAMTNSSFGREIDAYADAFTAVICKIDGNKPSSVCSNPGIIELESQLPGPGPHSPPPNQALMTGYPNAIAQAWATVQYGQMDRIRTTSVHTR